MGVKIKKHILVISILLFIILIISSCDTSETIEKTYKSCVYSNGSVCNKFCCKTSADCGNLSYSYRRCDLSEGKWGTLTYIDPDCKISCKVKKVEKKESPKEEKEDSALEEITAKLIDIETEEEKEEEPEEEEEEIYLTEESEEDEEPEEEISDLENIVSRVIDGDTFVLNNGERVRLIGIDTPEIGEICYQEATERLEDLVLGEEVILEKDVSEIDDYGRLLSYVYVNNEFVNLKLVEDGFARAYPYGPDLKFKVQFAEAEIEARHDNEGCLWTDYVEETPVYCKYVGSKNSDVYHKPSCIWAEKISDKNLVCFSTEEEAIMDFRRRCRTCW